MITNNLKTIMLLAVLSSIFLFFGALMGGSSGLYIAFIIAVLMNVGAYFFSDTIVLRIYKAQELDKNTYRTIYMMVESIARSMNLPMPRLWIINSPVANAFATGRNPAHASLAVTQGLLEILSQEELKGVLAHEMSHVANRDTLVATIAATLATAISYLAYMAKYRALWGSHRDKKDGANPLALLIIAMSMPLVATILQLAISRSREYLADASGAELTQDPESLISALQKLQHSAKRTSFSGKDFGTSTTACLCIVNSLQESLLGLFSTHPPLEKRIERLKKMF